MCGASHMQGITAPLVPNFLEEGREGLLGQGKRATGMDSLNGRSNLLHFHGRCIHHTLMNPSRLLRSHIVDALQDKGEDIHVRIARIYSFLKIEAITSGHVVWCLDL